MLVTIEVSLSRSGRSFAGGLFILSEKQDPLFWAGLAGPNLRQSNSLHLFASYMYS